MMALLASGIKGGNRYMFFRTRNQLVLDGRVREVRCVAARTKHAQRFRLHCVSLRFVTSRLVSFQS
eukprot:COSAG06_NODE_7225_length_2578_cov_1.145850_4_plen_66_part_00